MTVRDAIVSAAPLLIAAALLFGPIGAWLANRRARNPAVWLVLAAITGPAGLALLLAAPPGRCASCGEPTVGFRATCLVCGERTRHVRARRTGHALDVAAHGAGTAEPEADLVAATWMGGSPAAVAEPEASAVSPRRRRTRKPAAGPGETEPAPARPSRSTRSRAAAAAERSPAGAEAPVGVDRLTAVGARRASASGSGPAAASNRSSVPVGPAAGPVGPVSVAPRAPAAPVAAAAPIATMPGTGTPLRAGLSILAIGVFVQGSENLLPGARYLLARTLTHLVVVGPIEASSDHTELNLPLERVEAQSVADRLVVSGWESGRGRRWVLGFQSLNGLTATAIDEALRADPGRIKALAKS